MTIGPIDVGARIRAFRLRRGFTLQSLSRVTGIAASTLSAMELNKSSPTLATLAKIAGAFGMRAGELVDDVLYTKATLRRQGEGQAKESSDPKCAITVLTYNQPLGRMDGKIVSMETGAQYEPRIERSADRFAFCICGEVTTSVEGQSFYLTEGDSLYLLPETQFSFRNTGNGACRLLLVQTPKCAPSID